MKFLQTHPYILLFFFASAVFIGHYVVSGQAVYGDGIGYYAHLHSWYFDHDFDNTNEYRHIYSAENNNALLPVSTQDVQIVATSPTGKAENHYSTGPALLLLPFYIFADLIVVILNTLVFSVPRNGYSDIYQISVGLGAVAYTMFGIYLLSRISAFYTKNVVHAKLAAWTMFFATPLLYYGSFDVINSHFASFFLTTLFFFLMFTRKENVITLCTLGLVGGLLVSTRPQDGVALAIWVWIKLKNTHTISDLKLFIHKCLLVFGTVLIACLPFLIHAQLTFGSIFKHRYFVSFEQQSYRYTQAELFGSLFDPTKGLFTATPLLFVVFLFFMYTRKKNKMAYITPFFVFFCFQFLVVTLQGGWRAEAFGARMFVSSLPFFGIVLAEMLGYIRRKYSNWTAVILCTVFITLNFLMMGNFILTRQEDVLPKTERLLRLIQNLGT